MRIHWFISLFLLTLGSPSYAQENPPGWDDAVEALQIIGANLDGSSGRCANCHGLGRAQLRTWGERAMWLQWSCLDTGVPIDGDDANGGSDRDDPFNDDDGSDAGGSDGGPIGPIDPDEPMDQETALRIVNCMRVDPEDETSDFDIARLGLYAAGAHTSTFTDIFTTAFPEPADYNVHHGKFLADVAMPLGGENQMSEEEFNKVIQWSNGGMPYLERVLGLVDPPPTSCETKITDDFRAHVAQMEIAGWQAQNLEQGIPMFACDYAADPTDCFKQLDAVGLPVFPDARDTSLGAHWVPEGSNAAYRILRFLNYSTSYWMRSSADGRFIANGYSGPQPPDAGDDYYGGVISDLQPSLTPGAGFRDILVEASFDPSFFPNNRGFMFQGTGDGTGICHQSLIEDPATALIDWTDPACANFTSVSLYQAVSASLDGGDYLAITGPFNSDGGYGDADETPYWMEGGTATITPFFHDGTAFQPGDPTDLWTPYLGDWNISPSGKIAIGRMAGEVNGVPQHMGYELRFVENATDDDGQATFALRDAATICVRGAKGKISFDERMYTTYHYPDREDWREYGYSSPDDPEFQRFLAQGSADIHVVDLLTGEDRRVTSMGPGQYAMFPHYRSDGWLYFMVWDKYLDRRYAVATDASILMARGVLR